MRRLEGFLRQRTFSKFRIKIKKCKTLLLLLLLFFQADLSWTIPLINIQTDLFLGLLPFVGPCARCAASYSPPSPPPPSTWLSPSASLSVWSLSGDTRYRFKMMYGTSFFCSCKPLSQEDDQKMAKVTSVILKIDIYTLNSSNKLTSTDVTPQSQCTM
jgi:hypothetical protein